MSARHPLGGVLPQREPEPAPARWLVVALILAGLAGPLSILLGG